MLKTIQLSAGEGKHLVSVIATVTADGLVVQVMGGEKSHVGAVVMSLPRPSLSHRDSLSCNSYVLPRLNHKDDELAKPVAEKLAQYYGVPVVVVAGLHVDNASPRDIKLLIDNTNLAVDKLMAELTLPC
ncbi:hypothetical protein JOC37_002327 [Desulfohalotomaculum tongense]|uniref:prenylated flavin chaperone LpdD n=1 Tax=Desulforadius tongensis TaxID=1216062 RepID=UPI00195BBA16|nr:hypothetical protein [Desulforadius tongensis]MBM7855905.1 hypothetical protein [Desulforadius tongensis]